MESLELAKMKIERAIKYVEQFDKMEDAEFNRFIEFMENALKILPCEKREKDELQSYVEYISTMDFKKCGFVFKGFSRKGNVILTKKDAENIVWTARSLLF